MFFIFIYNKKLNFKNQIKYRWKIDIFSFILLINYVTYFVTFVTFEHLRFFQKLFLEIIFKTSYLVTLILSNIL